MSRCECTCEQRASLRCRLETLTTKDGWTFVATWREARRCRREKRRNIEADIVADPHLLMHEDGCSSAPLRSSLLCRCYIVEIDPCSEVDREVLKILERMTTKRIVTREERLNQHTHCTLTPRHTAGTQQRSLESTREERWFLPSILPSLPLLPSALEFRNNDSPRNVVDRYVISPRTGISNVSRRRWRRHRHSIGAFVIKDTARDPFRASAVARLLPMLADHGAARGNRWKPTTVEDSRTKPSAADSTGWNAWRKPAGIGIGIGCSPPVRRQSKANDRAARSSFLRAVEALKTAIIYVYYPSSPFASRPRYPAGKYFAIRGALNSRRFESKLNRASLLDSFLRFTNQRLGN